MGPYWNTMYHRITGSAIRYSCGYFFMLSHSLVHQCLRGLEIVCTMLCQLPAAGATPA